MSDLVFIEKYIANCEHGDFKYEVIDSDDWTGKVLKEQVFYKGKGYCGYIMHYGKEFEVEVDTKNELDCIYLTRSSRKSARAVLEQIIINDELKNGKNKKYVDHDD